MRWPRRKEVYGERRAARAVAVTTATRAGWQGALWGLVFGATIAASASAYAGLFPTTASRARMALSFQGNTAWAALFGPLRRLDTVAGYTVYKSGMTVIILGAIWGLLVATRVLRGEEDAGRWELFLSGQTTRGRAAVQAAIGLGAGFVALWVPTALLTVGAGASPKVNIGIGASLFFVTSLLAAAAMFMAIGMFVGQLAATRRDANLLGAGVLAASYLIRMAADSDAGLAWLRWLSPLGWIEELRPLTGSRPFAFIPIVALVAVLVVVAIRVARQRDLGASVLASRDTAKPRTLLLGGQAGLTVRLTRPVIAGWIFALFVTGLVFGLVAQAAGTAVRGARGLEQAIERLGGTSSGAASYLGFVFVIAAGLVAIAVAGQITAARNEEAAGHLDNLLVRPVARWRWLVVRLSVALGLVVVASVLAGFAAWLGAVSQHADVGLGELLKAGLNVIPPAVFVLGIGGLALGLWPRGAIGVVYGLVVWSFVVETIAAAFDSNHWLRDTSPLLHIAPVPAADPNWTAAGWLIALGLLAAALGVAAFGRRDLVGA
ncbi:MAG TPA: ABC transporter permease subunit [Actinomycetota bacterium]|nr:ABC transporter permease subunit [Actinomycetota bacterium]